MVRAHSGTNLALDPRTFEGLVKALTGACQKTMASQWTLLCSSGLRFHVRKLIERFLPQLAVVSPNDIPPNVQIVSLGVAGQGRSRLTKQDLWQKAPKLSNAHCERM